MSSQALRLKNSQNVIVMKVINSKKLTEHHLLTFVFSKLIRNYYLNNLRRTNVWTCYSSALYYKFVKYIHFQGTASSSMPLYLNISFPVH